MRDQIGKLKTIRTLRVKQRRSEYQAVRQELSAIEQKMEATRQDFNGTRAALEESRSPMRAAGATLTNADIERRAQLVRQYNTYLNGLKMKMIQIHKQREQKQKAVARALAALRAAERAVDQLDTVDEKLAEEEARLAEIQEELQSEVLAKPRWSTS